MSDRNSPIERDAVERAQDFIEVSAGYDAERAVAEAKRCLQCRNEPCRAGCPVEVDIRTFIGLIAGGRFLEAAWKIREVNSLPAVCGRVCPQENQCEKHCTLGKKYEPVAIGLLERFAAAVEEAEGKEAPVEVAPPSGHKVAVVGSGPAGLTAAGDLARMGHAVTVFEALHEPGGVLVYGIPEFRLPQSVVAREVAGLKKLGVEILTNRIIGRTHTVPELLENGYDAVFLGNGAGLPSFMNIPGEDLPGVYSANEYLTRINLMRADRFPESDTPVKRGRRVAVIGGGNVAMDAARSALRLGAERVELIYRRTEEEMPARVEERHHAQQEGVVFRTLTNPIAFCGESTTGVSSIECIRMELAEPDESGRRRPVESPGSEHTVEADLVVIAIGQRANPLAVLGIPGLETNKRGNIVADESGRTSLPAVFAGGDIVSGAATVILAMGAGKAAARAIDRHLAGLGEGDA